MANQSDIWCVVRGIPTSERGHAAADRLRKPGYHTRKRGRGARANPGNAFRGDWGYQPAWGGEYQDLPIDKAARFSMYVVTRDHTFPRSITYHHFQYAGIHPDGRLRVRPITREEYHHG